MAEGHPPGRSGEPDYDWLYGAEQRRSGDASREADRRSASQPSGDPDPTRMLPTMDRPSRRSADGGSRPPSRPGVAPSQPPRGRPQVSRTRPPGRSRRHLRRWVGVLVLLWVAFLVAVPVWAWSKVHKVDFQPASAPADQPGTTYLLVGSDSRAGLTRKQELHLGTGKGEGQRTDTIMLLHTGSGPNLLMSIPRDSIVPIPGHPTTKINAAFAWGGPKLLTKTIEQDTHIHIDHYVEIGFAGFVDVVNAVGGIQVCPSQKMVDPLANLHIKKGCQQVNGKVALAYARSRHVSSLGDIDRARHQREVVSAVGHKAVSPWSVINPFRYFGLAKAADASLTVGKGMSPVSALEFAWAMTHVSGKNGLTCSVPISDLAVHWDSQRAPRMFRLIRHDRTDHISKNLCSPSGLPGG
jgi:LCP family protein required for cell wall assembly